MYLSFTSSHAPTPLPMTAAQRTTGHSLFDKSVINHVGRGTVAHIQPLLSPHLLADLSCEDLGTYTIFSFLIWEVRTLIPILQGGSED